MLLTPSPPTRGSHSYFEAKDVRNERRGMMELEDTDGEKSNLRWRDLSRLTHLEVARLEPKFADPQPTPRLIFDLEVACVAIEHFCCSESHRLKKFF